jgi:hypothetical protein
MVVSQGQCLSDFISIQVTPGECLIHVRFTTKKRGTPSISSNKDQLWFLGETKYHGNKNTTGNIRKHLIPFSKLRNQHCIEVKHTQA